MGIAAIRLRPRKDQNTYTFPLSGNQGSQQQFIQVYQVEFDTPDITDAQLLAIGPGTSGPDGYGHTITIPDGYSILIDGSVNTGMQVSKIDVRRSEIAHVADVYVTYTTPPNGDSKTGTWNVTLSSDAEESTEGVTKFSDGTLITNVNGDIYPDGIPKTFYDERFSISFMTDAVEANALGQLRGKVNTSTVTLTLNGLTREFPPFTLLFKNAQWKTTYKSADNTYFQFSVTIELIYRNATVPGTSTPIGWAPLLVNKGYRRFIGGAAVVDDQGRPIDLNSKVITDPIFLGADGDQIDTTSGPTAAYFYPTTATQSGSSPKLVLDVADLNPVLTAITDTGLTG